MIITRERKFSAIFLASISLLLVYAYVKNSAQAFDDFYLPIKFSGMVDYYGYFKTALMLLFGADLPGEYRTYGVSRVIQYLVWVCVGGESYVYSLLVALSMFVTVFCLNDVLRWFRVSLKASISVSVVFLFSPFLINWSFHHYTYAILPFQILVFSIWFVVTNFENSKSLAIAALLGALCALTGELHLVLAATVAGCVFLFDRSKKRLLVYFIGAFAASLVIHFSVWSSFFKDPVRGQRFEFVPASFDVIIHRLVLTLESIPRMVMDQIGLILSYGWMAGIACAIVVTALYIIIVNKYIGDESENDAVKARTDINLFFWFLLFSFVALIIYVVLSVLTGQISTSMPRRYGYVPVTLVLIAFSAGLSAIVQRLGAVSRYSYVATLFFAVFLTAQVLFVAVPSSLATDRQIVSEMLNAAKSSTGEAKKGVLFFSATSTGYVESQANATTLGPKIIDLANIELIQSPFYYYWTAQHYSTNFLGFEFSAMPKDLSGNGSLSVGGSPYRLPAGKKLSVDDVIVVANLGFEEKDPGGKNIKVFNNYRDFEPNRFSRTIERDVMALGSFAIEEFVVDLGRLQGVGALDTLGFPDKKNDDRSYQNGKPWVTNYGLISGGDSVYSHPNISADFSYYKTNRNGTFTYGVELNEPGLLEISLDFWEQWGRPIGERIFEVEVSWDGHSWASLGIVDPAAINGNKPFSLVLTRMNPKVFQFRMKSVEGAKDIPMIQGLRLRKL